MLQILGKSESINVRKVFWLCVEMDLAYEHEQWGGSHRTTRTPEFMALNPNALVPVIRDGDLVLWESNTICRWNAQMAILEGQLSTTGAYVVGGTFTLADIVVGLSTHRWFMTPMDRPHLPAVSAYYELLSRRTGFMRWGRNGIP